MDDLLIISTNSINNIDLAITGIFIRKKRRQLGYNSRGVAIAVKISQPVISRIERGEYPGLKFITLNAILTFLDTSLTELEDYLDQYKRNYNAPQKLDR